MYIVCLSKLPAGCAGILSCFSTVICAFNFLIIISTPLATAESRDNIYFLMFVCISQQQLYTYKNHNTKCY